MNIKKISVLIAYIFMFFSIFSCEENDTEQSLGIEHENELYEIITPYLFLNNSKYELHLSKQEAFKKGISEDQYEEIYFDMQQLNAYIQDHINEPNHKFVFNDPQQKKEMPLVRSVRDIETGDGSIHGMRNYYGANSSLTVDIPRGYNQISVTVTPKCYFSAVTVGVGSQQTTFTVGGGTVSFNIGMSPSSVKIQVASNCDSGGSIGYTISK